MTLPKGLLSIPPVRPRPAVEHRRADRRFDRSVVIEFVLDGHAHAASTRNISLGGVFIDTEVKPPYGARIQLRFRVPTHPDVIEVGGQVRWCESEPGLQGIGVRFDGLRAREVWALNKFFSQTY